MNSDLFIITKSGWKYIACSIGVTIVFSLLDLELLTFISMAWTLFLLYHFRNPEREVTYTAAEVVVSPVDGVVKSIEEIDADEYTKKIEIESSCFNAAVLRAPIVSVVESCLVVRGTRLGVKSKLALNLNEYTEIIFKDKDDRSVKVLHRLKEGFAPISLNIIEKQKILKGGRYGFAQNSTTTLYLPKSSSFKVQVGQELLAAITPLAEIS